MVISRDNCSFFFFGLFAFVFVIIHIYLKKRTSFDEVKNIYNPDEKFSSPVSYAVTKAGVINLTKYLASYYRESNIRINTLTPGGVYDNHDEGFLKNYSYRTILGRMANKNEYNAAILFLSSNASSYMTGSNILVDGGWTAV